VRRDREILLVRQGAQGEELHWSLPGGVLEEGELVGEGLVREVREETGLEVVWPGTLAFVVQIDSRAPEGLRPRDVLGADYLATVWTFEIDEWRGEIVSRDPDGVVAEAVFVPLDEAIERLESVPWHSLTTRYLRGELEPGSLHLRRRHEDGRVEPI
jgi:8-oxo-dGTP diphosphatase